MARTQTSLSRIITELQETLNPSGSKAEKLDSFTIKQPAGTRERVTAMAKQSKVPFRDLVRACFEHGLDEFEAEFNKAAKRAARRAVPESATVSNETSGVAGENPEPRDATDEAHGDG